MGLLAVEKATLKLRVRAAAFILLLAFCGLNLLLLPTGHWVLGGMHLGVAFSSRTWTNFVREMAPVRLAVASINAAAGESSRVGFLGCPFGTGLQGEPYYGTWYDYPFNSDLEVVKTEHDALVLVDKWRLTHCIWDPTFDHPQRSIVEQALKSVAACQQQIESVTVLTIDSAAVTCRLATRELLRDRDFSNLGSDWYAEKAQHSTQQGGGVMLAPGGVLVQTVRVSFGAKPCLMCVDVHGSPTGSNSVRMQVRWLFADARDVLLWKSLRSLAGSAQQQWSDVLTAPPECGRRRSVCRE